MRTYDILWDHGVTKDTSNPQNAPDSVSVSPFAIMAIWRYRYPVTYSRNKQASFSKNPVDSATLRDQVLIVVEDIQSINIVHTKTNHVSQLNASLLPGANYMTEIFPGDWVAAWIVNDMATANSLLKRIRSGEPCNHFMDGLKFLGRMTAIRKRISQNPSGIRTSSYLVNAAGFQEFDASIYYEPHLASVSPGVANEWLRKTGSTINQIIEKNGNGSSPFLTANSAIPFFMSMFYGSGAPPNNGFSDSTLTVTKGLDNPNSFVIPDEIGNLLSVSKGTKPNGKKGWHDVCNIITGIQVYNSPPPTIDIGDTSDYRDQQFGRLFAPDGTSTKNGRLLKCPDEMLGSFLPSPPQFNGQRTIWSIFQQFLNPTINEMFTCLRAAPNTGRIMPTVVVRQLPFSSGVIDKNYKPRKILSANQPKDQKPKTPEQIAFEELRDNPRNLTLTRFATLPRWRIHPILIRNVDLGRSDALRFNFVHVYGESGLSNQNPTRAIVRDPPISDDLDIIRSGLRPYMATVSCSEKDVRTRKAGDWMYIISDIVMGQHMTLTGTMEVVGIQSPICPGDNLEFDDHIFHIETVSHTFSFSPANGMKSFSTSLALSHGVKYEQQSGSDFSMYTGTSPEDLTGQEPQTSREYRINKEEPSSPPQRGVETPFPKPPPPTKLDPDQLGANITKILKKNGQ